jgi:hypothetical protein
MIDTRYQVRQAEADSDGHAADRMILVGSRTRGQVVIAGRVPAERARPDWTADTGPSIFACESV